MHATRHQGSHVSLAHGLDNFVLEFHDRLPHLDGEERFIFIKRKISDNLSSPKESHHPNRVNFNIPKLPRTMLRQLPLSPHLGQVIETEIFSILWHIARTCRKSQVACSTIQSSTQAKCSNKIGSKIHPPCFEGYFKPANLKEARHKFMWFCIGDI